MLELLLMAGVGAAALGVRSALKRVRRSSRRSRRSLVDELAQALGAEDSPEDSPEEWPTDDEASTLIWQDHEGRSWMLWLRVEGRLLRLHLCRTCPELALELKLSDLVAPGDPQVSAGLTLQAQVYGFACRMDPRELPWGQAPGWAELASPWLSDAATQGAPRELDRPRVELARSQLQTHSVFLWEPDRLDELRDRLLERIAQHAELAQRLEAWPRDPARIPALERWLAGERGLEQRAFAAAALTLSPQGQDALDARWPALLEQPDHAIQAAAISAARAATLSDAQALALWDALQAPARHPGRQALIQGLSAQLSPQAFERLGELRLALAVKLLHRHVEAWPPSPAQQDAWSDSVGRVCAASSRRELEQEEALIALMDLVRERLPWAWPALLGAWAEGLGQLSPRCVTALSRQLLASVERGEVLTPLPPQASGWLASLASHSLDAESSEALLALCVALGPAMAPHLDRAKDSVMLRPRALERQVKRRIERALDAIRQEHARLGRQGALSVASDDAAQGALSVVREPRGALSLPEDPASRS